MGRLLLVGACLFLTGAAEPLPTFAGSSTGTLGIYRLESGEPLSAGSLVLGLGGEYFSTSGLFSDGEQTRRITQRVFVAFSPLGLFDLFYTQSYGVTDRSGATGTRPVVLGDPIFGLKAGHDFGDGLATSLFVRALLPTSPSGQGLRPDAGTFGFGLAFSKVILPQLGLAANVGYQLDQSKKLFKRELDPELRFAAGVSDKSAVTYGLGVQTSFAASSALTLGPFAEVSGAYAAGGESQDNPLRLTFGLKSRLFEKGPLELMAGADYALSGTPREGSTQAGIPPWEGFVRLGAHLDTSPERAPVASNTCSADAECGDGKSCVEGVCAVVKEVEKEVVREVPTPIPTFTIKGTVTDAASKQAVGGAVVKISGGEVSPLAADFNSGAFKSWPLQTGEGLVKITVQAPNYRPQEQTLPRGQAGEVKEVAFKLVRSNAVVTGDIRGSLKDARSGKSLKGQVFLPALDLRLKVGPEGTFEANVKAGLYQVVITSPGYAPQRKEIQIKEGEVVILNVDMARR